MGEYVKAPNTLCWDCKLATGYCSWSASLIPVEGWTATPTKKSTLYNSYLVIQCPLFQRDALYGGTTRYKEEGNEG